MVVCVEYSLHDRDSLCSFTRMLSFQYASIEESRIFGGCLENLVETIGGFDELAKRARLQ